MSYLIKEIPINERPRERFIRYGPKSLSNEELISILIRCGSKDKSVKDVSYDLLQKINLHDLKDIDYTVLSNIKGIGPVKAITILSAIELGKRVLSKEDTIKQIKNSDDIYYYVKDDLQYQPQEHFLAIFLDTKKNIIAKKVIFIGTVNQSNVYLRDVFRDAVKNNAVSMIIVHNHPAGSTTPSMQDTYITNEFIRVGKLLNIPIIDHLIIGKNDYYSYLESQGDLFA